MVIIRVPFAVIYLSISFLFLQTTFPFHLLSLYQSSSSSYGPLFPIIYYLSINLLPLLIDHFSLSFIIFLSFFLFSQITFHCHLSSFYQSPSPSYRPLFTVTYYISINLPLFIDHLFCHLSLSVLLRIPSRRRRLGRGRRGRAGCREGDLGASEINLHSRCNLSCT